MINFLKFTSSKKILIRFVTLIYNKVVAKLGPKCNYIGPKKIFRWSQIFFFKDKKKIINFLKFIYHNY